MKNGIIMEINISNVFIKMVKKKKNMKNGIIMEKNILNVFIKIIN